LALGLAPESQWHEHSSAFVVEHDELQHQTIVSGTFESEIGRLTVREAKKKINWSLIAILIHVLA